jgi:hypothetical protein
MYITSFTRTHYVYQTLANLILSHIKMNFSVGKCTVVILLTHYATAHFEGFMLVTVGRVAQSG